MTEPTFHTIRARDIIPYRHAIWCSIGDGDPFANTIVSVRWSEDGKRLVFMLDSHNFDFRDPDEEMEWIVVRERLSAFEQQRIDSWKLPERSAPEDVL